MICLDYYLYEDPKTGAVHVAWLHQQETVCGIRKGGQRPRWRRAPWGSWVDCDHCHAMMHVAASEEVDDRLRPVEAAAERIAAA